LRWQCLDVSVEEEQATQSNKTVARGCTMVGLRTLSGEITELADDLDEAI
jgi:hypothetical protein